MNTEIFDLNYTDIYDQFSNNTILFIYYHAYQHTVTDQKLIYKLIAHINYLLSDWTIVTHSIKYSYLFYKTIRYTGNYSFIINKLKTDINRKFSLININFIYTPPELFINKFEPFIIDTIYKLNATYKFLYNKYYIYYGKLDNVKQQLKRSKVLFEIDSIFDHNGIILYLKTEADINTTNNIIVFESNSHIMNLIIQSLEIESDEIYVIEKPEDVNIITVEPYDSSIRIILNNDFWNDKLYLGNESNFTILDENTYVLINNDLNLAKFNNMLKSFGALTNPIFNFNHFKIRPERSSSVFATDSISIDLSVENSEQNVYELIGYNQLKLIVNYNYSSPIWLDLLSLRFMYHFNDCAWTKYPYNYIDINTLKFSLGMIENKTEEQMDKTVVYDLRNPIINSIDKKATVLKHLNQIYTENLIISIYINALSPFDDKFKGAQLNYDDNISSIWISFKRPEYDNTYLSLNILWDWVKSERSEMREILENILSTNIKYCYNVKAIQLQLKKNGIQFQPETFMGDVLLAYWIYNPRLYDYYDEKNDINITGDIILPYIYDFYPCGYKYRYELRNIITNFIRNANTNNDEQTTYSIYPLILCELILPKLRELDLHTQYETELKVNYIYVDIEFNGITINQPKLDQLKTCMENFLLVNIKTVVEYFKTILPDLDDNWLLVDNNLIKYNYQLFIPMFKEYAKRNGYEQPYLEVEEPVPKSWKYFKAFILRNSEIGPELKSNLKLLQLILQMKYIYETKIFELKQNLKSDGKIHPCINSIGYNFGRLLTNSPNIHFAPNTESTQWGKYYRRCLQSKSGYKFIKADWKSQELYTLALLLDDPDFTRTLAGDFHINTGKILFPDQLIQIINIRKIDPINLEINFIFSNVNYTENVKGISIYKDDYYYTPSELKKKDGNMYEMKISIEKATNFEMEEGGFITYITNQQRQISKRLNFGLMYSEPISRFQEHLQIDYDTLKPYIDKWWQIYPKITEYIRTIRTQTNIHGYTKTFKGRRMFFPELLENSDIITLNAEKRDLLLTFVNSGTAVDLLKRSIILITESINEAGYDAHIVHTLHDEIIIEVIEKDIDNVKRIVEDIMTRRAFPEFLEKGINIGVDIDVCLWWDKCKETETSSDFIIDEDDCPNFID